MACNCLRVWNAIRATQPKLLPSEYDELCDAFTDFECAWPEHAKEYHTDEGIKELNNARI